MNTYRVTDDQGGETTQEAYSPETAAEQHAETQYNGGKGVGGNDHFDTLNVVVETPEGPVEFIVSTEFSVSFYAAEREVEA